MFVNDKKEGKGKLTMRGGDKIYIGDFKEDNFDGRGLLSIKNNNNNICYEG